MNEVAKAFQLAIISENASPSGALWYTSNGEIPNVSPGLANELALIFDTSHVKDGSWRKVIGMPKLTSKLYTTNSNAADTRAPVGSQIFRFTPIKVNGIVVDCKIEYLNDPHK